MAAQQKYCELCETTCKRDVAHCAMAKKFVAALWQTMGKVGPDSTSRNASANKNVLIIVFNIKNWGTTNARL